MLRRAIGTLAMRSSVLSIFSISISTVGLIGALYYAPAILSGLQKSPSSSILEFQAIGLFVFLFIALRSIFGDVQNIFNPGVTLESGTSIKDSAYDFFALFDTKCQEIFIIGQNLRTLLSTPGVLDHLLNLLRLNELLKITIILTVPGATNPIDDVAKSEYAETISELVEFVYRKLGKRNRDRVSIRCHPGATSLSAFIRDPNSDSRGVLVFIPKWATDREPGNRIFCVVRKWENPAIFNKLFGHIGVMTGQRSLSLEAAAEKVGVRIPK